MKPAPVAPVFVAAQPIMSWLDSVFLSLARQVQLEPHALTADWPPSATTAYELRIELVRRDEDDKSTDDLWAAIADQARSGGEPGRVWQILACGLAIAPLRAADRHIRAEHVAERSDIHADLIEAFLKGLRDADPAIRGILATLVDNAKKHAEKQHQARRARPPKPRPTRTGTPPQKRRRMKTSRDTEDLTETLQDMAARFAAAGHHLDPLGVELIIRTVIGTQNLTSAAADLGLGLDAAYKRRQRAENRIADAYQVTARRPAPGRAKTVSRARDRHATADGA